MFFLLLSPYVAFTLGKHSTDYVKCIHVHMSYDLKSNYLEIHQKPQKEPAKYFVYLPSTWWNKEIEKNMKITRTHTLPLSQRVYRKYVWKLMDKKDIKILKKNIISIILHVLFWYKGVFGINFSIACLGFREKKNLNFGMKLNESTVWKKT